MPLSLCQDEEEDSFNKLGAPKPMIIALTAQLPSIFHYFQSSIKYNFHQNITKMPIMKLLA